MAVGAGYIILEVSDHLTKMTSKALFGNHEELSLGKKGSVILQNMGK